MRHYLLPPDKHPYKTALHCHSTVSDGALSPEEIKKLYKERGYAAVAFTDHEVFIPHNDLSDDDFVALNGYEIAIKLGGHEKSTKENPMLPVFHLCLVAEREDTDAMVAFEPEYVTVGNSPAYIPFCRYVGGITEREYSRAGIERITGLAEKYGFIAAHNHPRWSMQKPEDYRDIDGLTAVEVYNSTGYLLGDDNAEPYDEYLRAGKRMVPIAVDDMHEKSDMRGGFTVLYADRLEYRALTAAYRAGDLYASSGPEIEELYAESGKIHIRTSPARVIVLRTSGRIYKVAEEPDGSPVNAAVFDIPEKAAYIRVEVRDTHGRTAYTRAYYPEEYADI